MTPQCRRVLAKARAFDGVCEVDFALPNVTDGGKPIKRVCARIQDLETKHGCVFECIGWRGSTKVFRLVEGPSEPERGVSHPSAFEPPSGAEEPPANASLKPGEQPALFALDPIPHWKAA